MHKRELSIITGTVVTITILLFLPGLKAQGSATGPSGYKLLRELPMPQETGWDYLSLDSEARRLYIASNSGAVVFDIDAGKVIGNIPKQPLTRGIGLVHGVAFAREFGHGFISHEVPPSVIMFDLQSLAEMGVTPTDPGTDAVIYDPASKRIFTFNGKKRGVHDSTVIDASSGKAIGTIPLPGSPEFPAVDETGHLYSNIASLSEMAQIDTAALKVTAVWPLAPCKEPSGLAIDAAHRRLFAACDNKLMAMVNADTGKIVATVPTGDGVDAVTFDPVTRYAFASAGEGTLTIAHEDSPDELNVVENVRTAPGARTMALDTKTHRVFLMAGRFQSGRPQATADNPHGYPEIVHGSAKLLIFGR